MNASPLPTPMAPTRRSWLRRMLWIVIVGWLVLWIAASLLVPVIARRAIPRLAPKLQQIGVVVTDLTFETVRVSPGLNGVTFKAVEAGFDLNPGDTVSLQSRFSMETLNIRMRNLFTLRGRVVADGMDVRFDAADLPRSIPFDRFARGRADLPDVPLTRPRQAVHEVLEGLKELFQENAIRSGFQLHGDVTLKVDEAETLAHLYTEEKDGLSRLRFRAEDVKRLAAELSIDLVPEQVEIISLYPLRVPLLIGITESAQDRARRHEPRDVWLRDAHRHITWSFLLTRRFGTAFAARVTDAHEIAPGNSADERTMDFHNNAVGRRLASQGVDLAELPHRIRNDSDIIRHPDQVAGFGTQRLLR